MARYIDADELYRETEKKIKANHECRMAVVDDEFLDLINDAFTEDVVPRAEIEHILSDLKKEIHDKAVYPEARSVKPYISLKVVDAIIINKMEEIKNEK